jgi:hypothetical protein
VTRDAQPLVVRPLVGPSVAKGDDVIEFGGCGDDASRHARSAKRMLAKIGEPATLIRGTAEA